MDPAPNSADGGQGRNAGGRAASRKQVGEEDTDGREGAGEATGVRGLYRDVGDRLYSEAKEAQRRHDARRRKVEAARDTESWSCPQCGAANR